MACIDSDFAYHKIKGGTNFPVRKFDVRIDSWDVVFPALPKFWENKWDLIRNLADDTGQESPHQTFDCPLEHMTMPPKKIDRRPVLYLQPNTSTPSSFA